MPSSTTTAQCSVTDRSLRKSQQWMQAAIMTPEAVAQTEEYVLPSRRMTPAERLGVYQGMYEIRLRGALETDYPLLAAFLGEDLWSELVGLYLEAHPSQSYTLNRLGDHLPGFLAELDGLPHEAFVGDLARFELARTIVFDAAETPPTTPEDIWTIPSESWETACLLPVAAFRLESFRYPVQDYIAGERPPRRKNTHLAVFRRDYRVLSLELSKPAFRLLEALAGGQTLGDAIQEVRSPRDALFGWFQQWVGEGLFREVVLPSQ